MGNCISVCLPSRRREADDEDDESRLLFDDASGMQYGSFSDQHMHGHDDPLEAQRELEALQKVVARTSDNMVDIFEIAPSENTARVPVSAQYALAGQDARIARYQILLSKLSLEDDDNNIDAGETGSKTEWALQDDDHIEIQRGTIPPVKSEAGPPLVGNFADAAKAVGVRRPVAHESGAPPTQDPAASSRQLSAARWAPRRGAS